MNAQEHYERAEAYLTEAERHRVRELGHAELMVKMAREHRRMAKLACQWGDTAGLERAGHPAKAPVNPCCDNSGFADYAAVPCPNPQCTAVLRAGEMLREVVGKCTCPVDPDGPERGDPLGTCPTHGWVVGEKAPTTPPASTESVQDAPAVPLTGPEALKAAEAAGHPPHVCPTCIDCVHCSATLCKRKTATERIPQCRWPEEHA